MKHPALAPSLVGPSPAAAGTPSALAQVGPQPQPDPWTIQGPAVYYAHSIVVGAPTGGPQGDGTLNAVALYYNGVPVDPALFLRLVGGTLTGPLIQAADPVAPLGTATKQYVDNHIAAIPPSLVSSDTPPASPYPGQLWWASNVGQLFVWYADPNSSSWVVCNNAQNSISLDMGSY